jgi:hypothetical protein
MTLWTRGSQPIHKSKVDRDGKHDGGGEGRATVCALAGATACLRSL